MSSRPPQGASPALHEPPGVTATAAEEAATKLKSRQGTCLPDASESQILRELALSPLLLLKFVLDGLVGVGVDLVLLAPGFGTQPLESPFPDLLADAGQIRRVEAFPAQKFAHGFGAVLGFQINLELFLGGQIPPLLLGALVRSFGWIGMGHFSVSVLDRQGEGMVPVALRAPSTIPSPSAL